MIHKIQVAICALLLLLLANLVQAQNKVVVFQSDFGLKDGAVSAMKGVATGVDPSLKLYDVTHEIPAYNIWEAAYRLEQTIPYWPVGTVFVSVVDPGVGTERKSVVLKTKAGHFIVTPDNGTLTLIAGSEGIEEIREIDEAVNRRKDSRNSYTFHGRDVYAYTGARLAAGVIRFEQVGPKLPQQTVVNIPYQKAVLQNNVLKGTIDILDIQYGNVWTNISAELFNQLQLKPGDKLQVTIYHKNEQVYQGIMPYVHTFGDVALKQPLAYLNSLMTVSFALNQESFAAVYHIESGNEWHVEITAQKQ